MKKFLTIGFLLGTSLQALGTAAEVGSILGPVARRAAISSPKVSPTFLNTSVVHSSIITKHSKLATPLPSGQNSFMGQKKSPMVSTATLPRFSATAIKTLPAATKAAEATSIAALAPAAPSLPVAKDSATPAQVNKSLPEKNRLKAAVSNPLVRKSSAPKPDAVQASSPGSAMTLPAAIRAKGFNNPEPVHPGAGGTRVVDKIELISTAQTSPLTGEMIHAPATGCAPMEPMTRLTPQAIPSMPEVFPAPAATSPAVEPMEPIARESDSAMAEPLIASEPLIAAEGNFSDDSNEDALVQRTTNRGFQAARQLPQADQQSNFIPSLGHVTTGGAQKAVSSSDQPSYAHQKAPYTPETRAPQLSSEPIEPSRPISKSFSDIFNDIKDAIIPFVKSSKNSVGSGESRRSSGQAFSFPEDTKPYSLGLVFSTFFFCGIRTPSSFISRSLRKALSFQQI